MTWDRWYRIKSYANSSLWLIPFVAIPLALFTMRMLRHADNWLGWTFLELTAAGAQSLLQTVISATLSFIVFTFGSLLVALQVASGQLTPRIIATTLLRNDVVRFTVGLFLFSLLFCLSTLNRIDGTVPQLVLFVAAWLGLFCFAAFLYLIDYAARLLRPISVLTRVGNDGLAVIERVYPSEIRNDIAPQNQYRLGTPDRVVLHEWTSEIILAVNTDMLIGLAERMKCIVEVVPQVGDFVAVDEPLFKLYGKAGSFDEDALRTTVAFGSERTMEQDPTFAFRIVLDIALRALSQAINDPTTSVLAIDQLHRMLRMVGKRDLRTDEILDRSGRLRVILRTPNWEDFVNLAFTEIRFSGSGNLQVVRRLRAMIENLLLTLPPRRHAALHQQLSLLDREILVRFSYPEDVALAHIADSQGLGGHAGAKP